MKGPKVNRRLVLIAFVVAVLLGAGGQAVALWSQSSTVTMGVTYGKFSAVQGVICKQQGNSKKVTLGWNVPQGVAVSSYVVTTVNSRIPGEVASTRVSTAEFVYETPASALVGDSLTVSIVAEAGSYSSETAVLSGIRVLPGTGGYPLACP